MFRNRTNHLSRSSDGMETMTTNQRRTGEEGRDAAGTCGDVSVHRLEEGALVHPVQPNHVAGVGIQARDAEAESAAGQSEVLALGDILQVCYLYDKAVKVAARGAPGRSEAVPCNVRNSEVHHGGFQLVW